MILLGVDTGGTFTDFIFKDGDTWGVYKILSTPSNPAEAVLNGIRHIARSRKVRVVHGSTVATNAILEQKGAVTALITNKGFEDVIEIGRQNRKELYNLTYQKNPPMVPEKLRFGVRCRVDNSGYVLHDLDEDEVKGVIKKLEKANVESVAVSFLFSFKNSEHEKRVGEIILSKLNIPISLSHEILSEFREFERTSTAVVNAYVSPKMKTYINDITLYIGKRNLRIMQSNGGSILAETAMHESVRTVLSGPAGGVVGAYEIGKISGYNKLITFDMGGTSTDVALIDDRLPLTMESCIAGYPVKVPMIDIHTVGAGGGSIACIDSGGSLKVGPESAGADPGPICYGQGDKITVTDANLFLGRLMPENFLGGNMKLYTDKLGLYFEKMSKAVGLSRVELAEGILSVTNTAMERAIRVISVERGFDPGEFTLFSFGGAGGMHAVFLARLLNIPKVLVPRNPGILSTIGMVMADIIKDYSLTVMLDQSAGIMKKILKHFLSLEKKGRDDLTSEGVVSRNMVMERYLDMRYRGQSYEIMVPFGDKFAENFHKLHEKSYGYCNREKVVEIVNIRLRARGFPEKPTFTKSDVFIDKLSSDAVTGEKEIIFDGKSVKTKIISRDKLISGNRIQGPSLLTEYSSTILIPPFASGKVDEYGNVIISVKN